MSYSIIISYNNANPNERLFVTKLMNYLGMKKISAIALDANSSEARMKQELPGAQWLVQVLTPEAVRSQRVQAVVNTGFEYVKRGNMSGVLALAFLSNPVEPEDMPYPWWSSIRTYYTGESEEEYARTFEKLARTLGYSRAPVQAASSSANDWASLPGFYDPASSRLSPTAPQSGRRPRFGLKDYVLAFLFVIVIILSLVLVNNGRSETRSTQENGSKPIHSQTPTSTRAKPPTISENPTPKSNELYIQDTQNKPPTFSMNAQDKRQGWDPNLPCFFNPDGTYSVTNTMVGQYTPCMAKSTKFKYLAYQVQMTIKNGDAGGLIFRSNDDVTTYYRFSLDSDGMYELFSCNLCPEIRTGNDSSELIQGNIANEDYFNAQSDMLTVIAFKNTIYLYVNGTFIYQINNTTILDSGEIGVFAASENPSIQTTEVAFSDVKVWELTKNGQVQ